VQVRGCFKCYAHVATSRFENKTENIRAGNNGFWNDFAVSAGSYVLPFTQLRGYLSFCGHLESPKSSSRLLTPSQLLVAPPPGLRTVLRKVPVAEVAAVVLGSFNAVMGQRVIEVVVGAEGNVSADDLARLGVRPGDHLRIAPVALSPRRSFPWAFPRDVGFTPAHLDEIRHDMSVGVGEDIEG
jgi:hypothetical protein